VTWNNTRENKVANSFVKAPATPCSTILQVVLRPPSRAIVKSMIFSHAKFAGTSKYLRLVSSAH
jgi:hypothetical protein